MLRELKRGFAFRLENGDVIKRTYDKDEPVTADNPKGEARVYRFLKSTGQTQMLKSPVLEVSELMIAGQEIKFVPTEEEAEANRAHVASRKAVDAEMEAMHSREFCKATLSGMTPEERKNMLKAAQELEDEEKELATAENKMVTGSEKKIPKAGCPDCGGTIQGVGFRHADSCPRKKGGAHV